MDAEPYRSKARHYLMCAQHVSDPNEKTKFLDIAAHWMALAERAEAKDRVASSNGT